MKPEKLVAYKIDLTGGQLKKLSCGGAIGLKREQLGNSNGSHTIHVRPAVYKKLLKNQAANKGVRLDLTQQEWTKSAAGGKLDLGKIIKHGFEKAGDKLQKKLDVGGRINIDSGAKKFGEKLKKALSSKAAKKVYAKAGQKAIENADKWVPLAVGAVNPLAGAEAALMMQAPVVQSGLKTTGQFVGTLGDGIEVAAPSALREHSGLKVDAGPGTFLGPSSPAMYPGYVKLRNGLPPPKPVLRKNVV